MTHSASVAKEELISYIWSWVRSRWQDASKSLGSVTVSVSRQHQTSGAALSQTVETLRKDSQLSLRMSFFKLQ